MEPHHQNDLRNLKFLNQLRFLIYLYWLKLVENLEWIRSPRTRVHWLGRAHRPRRLERLLLIVLMVISAVIFEPHEYMLWVCYWGGGVSLFVIVRTFYKLIQQYKTTNPPHWI